ncbi:MAG: hypothetical protein N3E36_00115 [Sulfolobales archaeon]|nr:hypothetical protein [Sulfolobales archaeon]MCX8198432.1 hypothetical protein [Sulfolobales archaeon]MDW8169506.1 hypothetical protein [Desulfurococcaceae archaeon]
MKKVVSTIDLRKGSDECIAYPFVKLRKEVSKLRSGEALRVLGDPLTLPLKTLKALAEKHHLMLHVEDYSSNSYSIILEKIS